MSSLASHLAAAEALVRAGSFAAARGHIDKALNSIRKALPLAGALFQLELEGGTPRACLGVALKTAWRSIPTISPPTSTTSSPSVATGSRREARDKLDAIAARFARFRRRNLGRLELLSTKSSCDPDETIGARPRGVPREVRRCPLARRDGHVRSQLEAVRLHPSASQVAEKVLASSPEDPAAHFVLALLAFYRSGRFGRARRHARKLIRIRPHQAGVGRELILASWLVWFPPSLIAHYCMLPFRIGETQPGHVRRLIGMLVMLPLTALGAIPLTFSPGP